MAAIFPEAEYDGDGPYRPDHSIDHPPNILLNASDGPFTVVTILNAKAIKKGC